MKTADIEIEIQVQVENIKELLLFLQKNAQFLGQQHQIDKYFTPKHRNFLKNRPIKEWLRLRDSSGKFSINYKNWHYRNGKSNYSDEYESHVDSLDQMEKIFGMLNLQPLVIVDKTRKIWSYKNYEVSIDSIKSLGDFVEIEFKGKATKKDASKITKEMVAFLKFHGCGKITRNYVGYPFQLLFPKEVRSEEQ